MVTIFLVASPILVVLSCKKHKVSRMLKSACILSLVAFGTFLIHMLVSPLFLERILISLNLSGSSEPIEFTQQAHLSFPKKFLFHICCGFEGKEYPFLNPSSLKQQGLSFYMGLCGLFAGLAIGRSRLAGLSLFGWLTYVWMLTVDMGEFRAETLRLLAVSHIALGGCAGLMIGLLADHIIKQIQENTEIKSKLQQMLKCAVLLAAAGFCLVLGWGNIKKFSEKQPWRISTSIKKLDTIQRRHAPDWSYLSKVDFDMFQLMTRCYIHSFKERLLIRLPEDPYRERITSAALTGAGLIGLTWERGVPRMCPEMFLYDYRSSLFFQRPSADLLNQLAPDWILIDPSITNKEVLAGILNLPGVSLAVDLKDYLGERRLLLRCKQPIESQEQPIKIKSLTLLEKKIETVPFGLAKVHARIDGNPPVERVKLALIISDANRQRVNLKDTPIVGVSKDGASSYTLYFSMLQKGRWTLDFAAPESNRSLNEVPLLAEVKAP